MDLLVWILGVGGVGLAAFAIVLWRLIRKSNQVEALRVENDLYKREIAHLKGTAKIFARPKPDNWDGTVDRL